MKTNIGSALWKLANRGCVWGTRETAQQAIDSIEQLQAGIKEAMDYLEGDKPCRISAIAALHAATAPPREETNG